MFQDERQKLANEIKVATEKKRSAFGSLKADMEADITAISQRITSLKSKVSTQISNGSNENGLLLHKESDYINCLQVNLERFSELLSKDEGIWEKKLEEASQNTQCDAKLDPLLENFSK